MNCVDLPIKWTSRTEQDYEREKLAHRNRGWSSEAMATSSSAYATSYKWKKRNYLLIVIMNIRNIIKTAFSARVLHEIENDL